MNKCIPLTALLIAFLNIAALAEEGWPRFRGPNGSGVSAGRLPAQWSESDYRWKIELPGGGHSSPVVFGEHVYVTCTNPQTAEQRLVCVETGNGKVAWQASLESKPYAQHRFNSFASATPAVDAKHIYIPVSSAEHHQLVAFTHEGREAWRYELGPFQSSHGSGASPIVYGDTVILVNDQDGPSFVVALDAATGNVKWKADRKSGKAAYATPCLYRGADGKDQLILVSSANGMTGIDPATGKTLWELGDLFTLRVCASPVVAGDVVIATCGEGGGGKRLVAVRPGSFDGSTPATLAYELNKALPYVPTPLYDGTRLFLLNDGGIATCLNPADGTTIWQERIGGDYFASPVASGGVIYCVSRSGEAVTFRAGDSYEPIARTDLTEPSHATPAITGDAIYLRTETHLIKLGPTLR